MSRIYSKTEDTKKPTINKSSVSNFFKDRAKKIESLGPIQAVIYQDKNPQLAMQRNKAEKEKLLPLLQLDGTQRILDVGCGTGRWADILIPECSWYHGIDACDELIEFAKKNFSSINHSKFTAASINSFSLESLNEKLFFERILCMGVLIYLNDEEFSSALHCIANALSPQGLFLLREPVGTHERLTIKEHYSEDMEQEYNAIYRTKNELLDFIENSLPEGVLKLIDHGNVYGNNELNNRSDTKQEWFLFQKMI